jgi:hypothetical protein
MKLNRNTKDEDLGSSPNIANAMLAAAFRPPRRRPKIKINL